MTFALTNENIDRVCTEADAFLAGRRVESKERIRVRLNLEEVLLHYQTAFGSDAEFSLDQSGTRLRLRVRGPSLDPFASSERLSDEDVMLRDTLSRMGRRPYWQYRNGVNEVLFRAKRKRLPDWLRLAIAVAAALCLGLLARLLPPETGAVLQGEIVAPLNNTFLGFLNAIAGPMIFLAVVWGIYSIGDASTFSEIGKRLSVRYGAFIVTMSLAMVVLCMPLFALRFGHSEMGSGLSALYRMVLNIVPGNLFAPFAEGNTLQILFIGFVVGIAMLLIGQETKYVADLAEQLGILVNGIMGVVSRLVPVFVFASLFNVISTSKTDTLATGGKFFYTTIIGCTVMLLLHTAVVYFRTKLPPVALWKKTLSTFVIAVTTASSSAAFSDNLSTCIGKLGISKKLANFGVPFGQILYKPGVCAVYWFAVITEAESRGVEVSAAWLITALFMCIVLSAATPTIPGGTTASFGILFAQLGLPVDNLGVILALNIILDFYHTATNLFSSQCILLTAATKLNMIESGDSTGEA